MTAAGFPHSGITGSKPACGSPMLFAAYHALPRLSVPRHPPCALVRLTGISNETPHPIRTLLNFTHAEPFRVSARPAPSPHPLGFHREDAKNDHAHEELQVLS
jgi:hypothetical protein